MPKSKSKRRRYQPPPRKKPKPSPRWYGALILFVMLLGVAVIVLNYLGSHVPPALSFQQLYPIPSRELSVSPLIVQNPGYSR